MPTLVLVLTQVIQFHEIEISFVCAKVHHLGEAVLTF